MFRGVQESFSINRQVRALDRGLPDQTVHIVAVSLSRAVGSPKYADIPVFSFNCLCHAISCPWSLDWPRDKATYSIFEFDNHF